MNKNKKKKESEKSPSPSAGQQTKLPTPEEIKKLMPKKWKELTDFEKDINKLIKEIKSGKDVTKMPGLNPVVVNMMEFLYKFKVVTPCQAHYDFFLDKMMPEILVNKEDNIRMITEDKFNETYRKEFERRVQIEAEQLKDLPHEKLQKSNEEDPLTKAAEEVQKAKEDTKQHNQPEELGKSDK